MGTSCDAESTSVSPWAAGRRTGLDSTAARLAALKMRTPRPRAQHDKSPSWTVASLQALLRNPLYKGDLLWNRSEWVRDHETGKRRRYERAESEWVRQHDEAWRIVPDQLWEQVQARRRITDGAAVPRDRRGRLLGGVAGQRSGRARHVLGGLLACGTCGGAFFAVSSGGIYACGWHRDRGPDVCPSTLRVSRESIETRVFDAMRTHVLTPETIAPAVERAVLKVMERLRGKTVDADAAHKRLREVESEIENATRLAIKAGHVEAVARALQDLEAERVEIERRIDSARPIVVDLETLRARVEHYASDLRSAFAAAPDAGRATLQRLLAGRRIAVHSDPVRGFRVEGAFDLSLEMTSARFREETGRLVPVVAGERFVRVPTARVAIPFAA